MVTTLTAPPWVVQRGGDCRGFDRRSGREVFGPGHPFYRSTDLLATNGLIRFWCGNRGVSAFVNVEAFRNGTWIDLGKAAFSDSPAAVLRDAHIERVSADRITVALSIATLGPVWLTLKSGERVIRVQHGQSLAPTTTLQRVARWLGMPPTQALSGAYLSGFTPADLSPRLWLEADGIAGLVDGAGIATWPDQSGNGLDFVQATAAKQPLFKTAILGGHPVARFDGINDLMTLASIVSTSEQGALYAVASTTSAAAYQELFSVSNPTGTSLIALFVSGAGKIEAYQADAGVSSSGIGDQTVATGVFHRILIQSDDVAWSQKLDGVAQAITLVGTNGGWFADAPGATSTALGALKYSIETQWWSGDIAALLLFDDPLSSADLARLDAWCLGKYGV